MNTNDFDYHLPLDRIAQTSVEPRDQSKLLCIDRANGTWEDHHSYELPEILQAGDVLVLNNSRVFNARLTGTVGDRSIELFLLRPVEGTHWSALARPGRYLPTGTRFTVAGTALNVVEKRADGTLLVDMGMPTADVIAFANTHGRVPIPPYIEQLPTAEEAYQTAYADPVGSVAAPTSGFHLTPRLLEQLKERGIEVVTITLHVGLGTFKPIVSDTLEEHDMHAEWVQVPQAAADAINAAKAAGRRIIAVGTTTTRTLEGIAADHGALVAYEGDVNLFITPGFTFQVIDGLFTNFHLPRTTLLALVSAVLSPLPPTKETADIGRERLLAAYQHALENDYRFASFGDAMLIC